MGFIYFSTYNTDHTVDTHENGVLKSGSVNDTLPMLVEYYYSMGLYAISPSESSESENDENEGESIVLDEQSQYSDVSVNSHHSNVRKSATPPIDGEQFLVASTSGYEGSELISTNVELWSSSVSASSPSSPCTSTSEYSEDTLPSYAELLNYSPAIFEQPQPIDSILVPKECMFDIKLRCPPDEEIIRIPVLEQAIHSLQDHPPPDIEQDYIQVINTSSECINISSDSDVVCLA